MFSSCYQIPDGDKEILALKASNCMKNLTSKIEISFVTIFGTVSITVEDIRESQLKLASEMAVTEEVAVVLNKSLSRSLALSGMEGTETDALKKKIDILVANLPEKIKLEYESIYNPNSNERRVEKDRVIKHIINTVQEKIEINYTEKMRMDAVADWKKRNFSTEPVIQKRGFWSQVGSHFSWLFGYRGAEIEADYLKQLQAVIAELHCDEIRYERVLSTKEVKHKGQHERNDLFIKVKEVRATKESSMTAYLLERMISSHIEDRKEVHIIEKNCATLWFTMLSVLHMAFYNCSEDFFRWCIFSRWCIYF